MGRMVTGSREYFYTWEVFRKGIPYAFAVQCSGKPASRQDQGDEAKHDG